MKTLKGPDGKIYSVSNREITAKGPALKSFSSTGASENNSQLQLASAHTFTGND